MKKCKFCNSSLKHIGHVDPGMLIKEASIHRFTGMGIFILLLLVGLLASIPLWTYHPFFAAMIIAISGGIGVYLWQKPKALFRCSNCGTEFYGNSLNIYKK